MEKSGQQSLQASMLAKRRTSLGSISSRKRNNNSMSYDVTSSSNYPNYLKTPQRKLRPIAGGSWDDNSLGYGSVAARMRRDRHRAIIRRTQASSTYTSNATDASASVENTLNLINTTDLAPWHPFGWDDDLADFYGQAQTVATKRSAGSLCNISSPNRLIGEGGSYRPWDSQSIPESRRKMMREKLRNSFSSAHHHHSSPTSGCASIASSDIDSADFAFFSVNDDSSSLFDGDSLFSDSYGVLDGCNGVGDTGGFSTDIFSMLEDGSISCRTPFPNGDWPDSISELNFDCSNEQYQKGSNISNCDAHSDIMPSSSASNSDKNRLKKRKLRTKSINRGDTQKCGVFPDVDNKIEEEVLEDQRRQETEQIAAITEALRRQAGKTAAADDDNSEQLLREVDMTCVVDAATTSFYHHRIATTPLVVDPQQPQQLDNQTVVVLPPPPPPPPVVAVHHTHHSSVHLAPPILIPTPVVVPTTTLAANCPQRKPPQHKEPTTTTATTNMPAPAVINLQLDLNLYSNDVTNVVINSVRAKPHLHHHTATNGAAAAGFTAPQTPQKSANSSVSSTHHLKVDAPSSPALKKAFKVSSGASVVGSNGFGASPSIGLTPVRVPITLNLKGWNYMTKDEREGFIERLSHKISTTMSLEEQLDIIRIIEGEKAMASNNGVAYNNNTKINRNMLNSTKQQRNSYPLKQQQQQHRLPFRMSVDDIDSHKLIKLLGYLDTHKGATGALTGLFSATSTSRTPQTVTVNGSVTGSSGSNGGGVNGGCSLRRSNSDGNLNIAGIEQTKETPRRRSQLPQQRKFPNVVTKRNKQRQRKECRQLIREQRSGLFVNEQKLKIAQSTAESDDDEICVDI